VQKAAGAARIGTSRHFRPPDFGFKSFYNFYVNEFSNAVQLSVDVLLELFQNTVNQQ